MSKLNRAYPIVSCRGRVCLPEDAKQTVFGGTTIYPTAKNGQGLSFDTIEREAGEFFIKNPQVQKVFVLDFNKMISALYGVEI